VLRSTNKDSIPIKNKKFLPVQTCTDGNFETWTGSGFPYVFRRGQSWSNTIDMLTDDNAGYTQFNVGTTINLFNNYASLVSNGTDPEVGAVQRVNNGSRAIKLGKREPDNSSNDVVTMSRTFVINENFFNFSYNLILNNPSVQAGGHGIDQRPIFLVRLFQEGNIVRSLLIRSDPQDCQFNSTRVAGNDGTVLYTGWRCGSFDVGIY
jgi:hypothetical protein